MGLIFTRTHSPTTIWGAVQTSSFFHITFSIVKTTITVATITQHCYQCTFIFFLKFNMRRKLSDSNVVPDGSQRRMGGLFANWGTSSFQPGDPALIGNMLTHGSVKMMRMRRMRMVRMRRMRMVRIRMIMMMMRRRRIKRKL